MEIFFLPKRGAQERSLHHGGNLRRVYFCAVTLDLTTDLKYANKHVYFNN